jgi:hypothetical protein
LRIIQVSNSGGDLSMAWLGGISGWRGSWSMAASTNLLDWTILESRNIPRNPTGTNTWVHPNATSSNATLFYRPCIEDIP